MPRKARALTGAMRKVVPIIRLPRSKIRMGTAGCCRRFKPGFPAGEWESTRASTKDVATLCRAPARDGTAPRRVRERRTPTITGGTGTRLTSARARTAAVRRRPPPPPIATWTRSITFPPDDYQSLVPGDNPRLGPTHFKTGSTALQLRRTQQRI